jgi:hypothetical protein
MMPQGLWVLAFLFVLDGRVIVVEHDFFINQQMCLAWREREEREMGVEMTCYRQYDYEI